MPHFRKGSRQRPSWLYRFAWGTGLFLFAAYLLYVAGVALVLNTDQLRTWTKNAPRFRLAADSGYSFWPGNVHLKNAELVVQDFNMTMQIVAGQVELQVRLLPLLSGTLHVDDAVVSGGKVRMRHRVDNKARNQKRLAAFPHIPGFERNMEFPPQRPPRGKQRTVIFDHIRAEASELWFLEYRATGSFVAHGGFQLTDKVEVSPCWLRADGVDVHVGDTRTVSLPRLDLRDFELGPFPRRKAKISEVLGGMKAQLGLRGEVLTFEPLLMYFHALPIETLSGHLAWNGDLTLEAGKMKSANLKLVEAEARARVNDVSLQLSTTGELSSSAAGELDIELQELRLEGDGAFVLAGAETRTKWHHDSLAEWQLQRIKASFSSLKTSDAAWLQRLTGKTSVPAFSVHDADAKLSYRPKPKDLSLDGHVNATLFVSEKDSLGWSGSFAAACSSQSSKDSKQSTRQPASASDNKSFQCSKLSADATPLAYKTESGQASLPLSLHATDFDSSEDLKDVDSTWQLTGNNPKSFASTALSSNLFAKLGIAVLPMDSWDANIHLNRQRNTLAGRLERTEIGQLSVSGRFLLAEAFVSAWELETPVGRYGIQQGVEGTQLVPFVNRGWLQEAPRL